MVLSVHRQHLWFRTGIPFLLSLRGASSLCHCEERSDAAISSNYSRTLFLFTPSRFPTSCPLLTTKCQLPTTRMYNTHPLRHCEERSDEAISYSAACALCIWILTKRPIDCCYQFFFHPYLILKRKSYKIKQ